MTTITLYEDGRGQYRWRVEASGKPVADSAAGHESPAQCARELKRLLIDLAKGKYTVEMDGRPVPNFTGN